MRSNNRLDRFQNRLGSRMYCLWDKESVHNKTMKQTLDKPHSHIPDQKDNHTRWCNDHRARIDQKNLYKMNLLDMDLSDSNKWVRSYAYTRLPHTHHPLRSHRRSHIAELEVMNLVGSEVEIDPR